MQEGACREPGEGTGLPYEDVSFSSIPGQTNLFLQYLSHPLSLTKYYPTAAADLSALAERKDEVLSNYMIDRRTICAILKEQNETFRAGPAVFDNIEKLREADSIAVLTGQQVGLFTGPLYTIYKAVSAIRSAEALRQAGLKAVPIFWLATEDHDLEEVSNAFAIDKKGRLAETRIGIAEGDEGSPVGNIQLKESVRSTIDEWLDQLPNSDFTSEVRNAIDATYAAGSTFGASFGKLLSKLLAKFGLILFDPLDDRVKQLSSPIVQRAIEHSDEIVKALTKRSEELVDDGFHPQVFVEENYFPLFVEDATGKRRAVKRTGSDRYRIAGSKADVTCAEILQRAKDEPSAFSAGVMLRPVVQDFLFPTICYVGGAAEIAYFAQNSEVYRLLERPVTPIFHRQSFSIVERKHHRTMEKYGLRFEDIFRGFDKLLPEIIERVIDPETPRVFAEAEETINRELNKLDQRLSKIDPTLSDALAARKRKVAYHIAAIRTKFDRARIHKDDVANRRLTAMFCELYPNNGLQERSLNFAHFANLHGVQFIDWVYDSIDVCSKDHRVLYL